MKHNKIEILAPAGNKDSFISAINAGYIRSSHILRPGATLHRDCLFSFAWLGATFESKGLIWNLLRYFSTGGRSKSEYDGMTIKKSPPFGGVLLSGNKNTETTQLLHI